MGTHNGEHAQIISPRGSQAYTLIQDKPSTQEDQTLETGKTHKGDTARTKKPKQMQEAESSWNTLGESEDQGASQDTGHTGDFEGQAASHNTQMTQGTRETQLALIHREHGK